MKKAMSIKNRLISALLVLVMMISSLVGTTFAWFTDTVTSVGNTIESGSLKVDLLHKVGDDWISLKENEDHLVFDYKKWEPGFTLVETLKVQNLGSLALKYRLSVEVEAGTATRGDNGEKLADVIDVWVYYGETSASGYDAITAANSGWVKKGTLSEVMKKPTEFINGNLLPTGNVSNDPNVAVGNQTVSIALHMQESAGNEYQGLSVGDIYVNLLATQLSSESDSYGSDYDNGAEFPTFSGSYIASAPVELDNENKVVNDVMLLSDDGTVGAIVPAGTLLKPGTTKVTLNVDTLDKSESNIVANENQNLNAIDVHVAEVAEGNTTPIIVTIEQLLAPGLNMGNYDLYHVEGGATVAMSHVADATDLDVHNEFTYDPATGDVKVAMASFSEVVTLSDKENVWEGNYDYTWYDASKSELTIANADQLAALGAIVGGMKKVTGKNDEGNYTYSDDVVQDSFEGKTVKLIANINIGDTNEYYKDASENGIVFYPIGYYNSEGTYERTNTAITSGLRIFEGTFDGNGHTISNFYHNTWEMKGDHNWYDATLQYYRDGMGLFGRVYGGTVKNLTVTNFSSDGEIATTGVIAAYADGATFENIAIFNCNPRVYNIGNGGIVGCVGWYAKEAGLVTTFKNITVDNTNKISALWGSYDVACGGIVGQYYPTSGQSSANYPVNAGMHFDNCHIGAQLDVYNDVCANYQYYAYRYAGMLIGSVRENETIGGHEYPKMDNITAKNCTVHFGTWNDYYYCEFEKNGHPSYSGPDDYKFSRIPHSEINFTDSNGNGIIDTEAERASVTGCKHEHSAAENNQCIYLPFNNLVTGYGWGVTTKVVGELDGVKILDRTEANSVDKFEVVIKNTDIATESTMTIGELFKAIENAEVAIKSDSIQVAVSRFGATSTAGGTYVANTSDWTQGTLTFSGMGNAVITITDYYFCKTATITVNVVGAEKFDTNFVNYKDYLYRVGNADKSTVALGTIFKHSGKGTINSANVDVTVTNIVGNASGVYTADTTNWTKGTIQFTGTGVVKVTIKDDTSKEFALNLEVVDAVNTTGATNATDNNVVLLNDIGSGFTVSGEYTFFGNGFTLTYTGDGRYLNNGLKQGIVTVKENGRLDNLRIIATIYPASYLYYEEVRGGPKEVDNNDTSKIRYFYQLSAVAASGNSTISNCYIYGARTNIFVDTGNVTISDTVLECGTLANLQIQSTNEYTVTLNNLTTIQKWVQATDEKSEMLGTGIIVGPDMNSNPNIILDGHFKQYNWVNEDDYNKMPEGTSKAIINTALSTEKVNHTVNGKKSSNLGIIFLNKYEDTTIENNTGLPYEYVEVTLMGEKGRVYSLVGATSGQIYSNVGNADRTTVNGDYLPTFEFDLGSQEDANDGNGDNRILTGDKNGITALYQDGQSPITLDLTKLVTVIKYGNSPYDITAVCKDSAGNIVGTNTVVTLSAMGNYTIIFTITDNIFYDKDGQPVTKSITKDYIVPLNLTVKEADFKDAVVNITKTALDGEYNTVNLNDYELRIKFLDCISVTDYDNKGNATTVTLSSNISSATLAPSGVNVFTTAFTATITYTDGRVLTVNFSKISGSSPGTKTGKVNTSGSVYFTTEGALNNKPTEADSQNKCTITSVSFKGNSGSTITNDTDVTVTWALDSGNSGGGCVTGDTLVTLADGTQKRVDQLTYDDQLLVWDFYNGVYTVSTPSAIYNYGDGVHKVTNLKFSDGTVVKMIAEHELFDVDKNSFVYICENNVSEFVGREFLKVDGDGYTPVTLVGYEFTEEYTGSYTVLTAVYYNCISEGMFSLTADPSYKCETFFRIFEVGEGMKFNEEKMQADIEKYGLYTYEDFEAYVTYEEFVAFGGAYFKVLVGKGLLEFEDIITAVYTYAP